MFDTILAAEEGDVLALQAVINAGQWSLQGSFGRSMMGAIEAGDCMLGKTRARDYWGNLIPSRDDATEAYRYADAMLKEREPSND